MALGCSWIFYFFLCQELVERSKIFELSFRFTVRSSNPDLDESRWHGGRESLPAQNGPNFCVSYFRVVDTQTSKRKISVHPRDDDDEIAIK